METDTVESVATFFKEHPFGAFSVEQVAEYLYMDRKDARIAMEGLLRSDFLALDDPRAYYPKYRLSQDEIKNLQADYGLLGWQCDCGRGYAEMPKPPFTCPACGKHYED